MIIARSLKDGTETQVIKESVHNCKDFKEFHKKIQRTWGNTKQINDSSFSVKVNGLGY